MPTREGTSNLRPRRRLRPPDPIRLGFVVGFAVTWLAIVFLGIPVGVR